MQRGQILFASCILLAAVMPVRAKGDVFELGSGGRVEGKLLNPDESPRTTYIIETRAGVKLELPTALVARVVEKSPAELQYETLLPRMPASADGNWKMAEWCRENGLAELRTFHLERAIELDSDFEPARRALGYGRVDGKWLRSDDYMRSQGFVRHKGAWRLRQEIELASQHELAELKVKEWQQKIKMWRSWIGKKRQDEAVANFRAIRDPLAAAALAGLLQEPAEPQLLRFLYIEVLGQLPGSAATTALASAALDDPDDRVRDKALDQLVQRPNRSAVARFIKALTHKENGMVNRAATALGRLKDPTAVAPLIEALITEHKFLVGGSPGSIGATFSPQGGGGLNTGSKPRLVKQKFQNSAALEALVTITNENHHYDQAAWRHWYTETQTPKHVDLRRSE